MSAKRPATPGPRPVRCAIYTRKSSEEGLDQEFNSLHAQRESAEAYAASQRHEGWTVLPERYDDGGYTGGNMDRPALQRLMAAIEVGKIDCVLVYKVDRLSRSLADFARMMERFEKHGVSFVAVTQHFNSASSMGRLTLNVLLSFAQFEREIASERTRDKIAAARRKGKWAGGRPVLGYDLAGTKLTVNESEACLVREVFALYLRTESIGKTVEDLNSRGVRTKKWTSKAGRVMGGQAFCKSLLHNLLTNPVYLGKVEHKGEVFAGEQAAIVDEDLWRRAQELLQLNGSAGASEQRNRHGALLKGLLRCRPCAKPMTHTYATKDDGRCYRYYLCHTAQTRGYHACSSRSVPAEQIEKFVIERVKGLGRDRALVTTILDRAREQDRLRTEHLEIERRALERELRWVETESRRGVTGEATDQQADLVERTRKAESRLAQVQAEIADIDRRQITREQVEASTMSFEPLWRSLSPKEQAGLLRLLIKRVEFDGAAGEIAITFHPDAPGVGAAATPRGKEAVA